MAGFSKSDCTVALDNAKADRPTDNKRRKEEATQPRKRKAPKTRSRSTELKGPRTTADKYLKFGNSKNVSCNTQSKLSKVRNWDCEEKGTISQFLEEDTHTGEAETVITCRVQPHSSTSDTNSKRICNWIDCGQEELRKIKGLKKKESEGEEKKKKMESQEVTCEAQIDLDLPKPQEISPYKPLSAEEETREIKPHQLDSHVSPSLRKKVEDSQFVQLNRLIKRIGEPPKVYKLVNNGGYPSLIPDEDYGLPTIDSYDSWLDAFQIFATIYSRVHPTRAWEMFHYMNTIRKAAKTYRWDNVYDYDVAFRRRMAGNSKEHWDEIWPHAWCLKMVYPLHQERSSSSPKPDSDTDSNSSRNTGFNPFEIPCRYYNNGKCLRGDDCWYAHECSICGENGHGRYCCEKMDQMD